MRTKMNLGAGDPPAPGESAAGVRRRAPVVEEYARLAPIYETRWSYYIAATIRETMARVELADRDRVLDLGCGTGALLEPLYGRHPHARFVGLDPVPEMLAIARRRLPPEITLCRGWAEYVPFASGSFDVIVSANMFHYVRVPEAALAEMRRVLRRGGRLVLTDWCDDYLACRICDYWLRWTNRAHVKTYRVSELKCMLSAAGFGDVTVDRYKISRLWGLMTARAT